MINYSKNKEIEDRLKIIFEMRMNVEINYLKLIYFFYWIVTFTLNASAEKNILYDHVAERVRKVCSDQRYLRIIDEMNHNIVNIKNTDENVKILDNLKQDFDKMVEEKKRLEKELENNSLIDEQMKAVVVEKAKLEQDLFDMEGKLRKTKEEILDLQIKNVQIDVEKAAINSTLDQVKMDLDKEKMDRQKVLDSYNSLINLKDQKIAAYNVIIFNYQGEFDQLLI